MSNTLIRTLSGIAFVIVIVGCLLLGMSTYCVLFALITALLLNEFNELLARHDIAQVNNTVSIISGVYLFIAFFLTCSGSAGLVAFAPYILSLLFILISNLYSGEELSQKDSPPKLGGVRQSREGVCSWAYTFAGQLYIALPMALLNVLAFNQIYSPILPLAVFVFLWLNDTGAYCFGCTLGKKVKWQINIPSPFRGMRGGLSITHKLFPSISPKKTWVGSIGGAIVVLLGAWAFHALLPLEGDERGSVLFWLGLGLTVCVFGTWGDLVESQFKRTLGIKDSGNFLPGHGGALDRFDSALLAIPAATAYVLLWGI
ncbi:MAG: phosphatidate cytidylyltransferase [Bacteroidaceae bacterium]|nr:phosphatidate cytidylyltransferase [Bacteroidaceae bacterium]